MKENKGLIFIVVLIFVVFFFKIFYLFQGLSFTSQEVASLLGGQTTFVPKLVPNFTNQENYFLVLFDKIIYFLFNIDISNINSYFVLFGG